MASSMLLKSCAAPPASWPIVLGLLGPQELVVEPRAARLGGSAAGLEGGQQEPGHREGGDETVQRRQALQQVARS